MQDERLPVATPLASQAEASETETETAPSERAETMKLLACKTGILCCGLALLLPFSGVAQEPPSNAADALTSANGKVVAQAPWRVSGKEGRLVCEVSQKKTGSDSSAIRALTIYGADGAKLFAFETPDSLIGMYQTGDYKGRFVTLWMGGSAYHLRVWNFVDGGIKSVLDQGAKLPPELVYDDQGKESVLITDPVIENGKWTATKGTTTVFKWSGESYSKIGTVPWAKRFQCISGESCTSKQ
jgi:hypothetical protein